MGMWLVNGSSVVLKFDFNNALVLLSIGAM